MDLAADVSLRRAGADDAAAIAHLHADSWRRHYRGAYSDQFLDGDVLEDRLATWGRRLASPSSGTFTVVAEHDSTLVGFGHVVFDDDPRWGSLLDNLHVLHDARRSGIGTRLLAAIAEAVVERRSDAGLYLWVLEQNVAAQRFYQARGGVCVEHALLDPPGGIPARMNGSPMKLRYVWPIPAAL
jgi:ribosomal protein S18 acetylase RimI-like enzyme